MASGRNQQASSRNGNRASAQGGTQMPAMQCDSQASAQFFSAFKTFYMQCRPGVKAHPAPPPASQDYIPDTLTSNQERPSTSASGSGSAPPVITSVTCPLTRSQSSCSLRSKLGPSGGRAPLGLNWVLQAVERLPRGHLVIILSRP